MESANVEIKGIPGAYFALMREDLGAVIWYPVGVRTITKHFLDSVPCVFFCRVEKKRFMSPIKNVGPLHAEGGFPILGTHSQNRPFVRHTGVYWGQRTTDAIE